MSTLNPYKPSIKNINKYGVYIRYFANYIKYGDFKSLWVSIKYVITHKLPKEDYTTKSAMGKFNIRKNTTDFQFINYGYEPSIKDYLSKNMSSFDVFIDLGACMGEYCIWLARQGKQCVAVEPVNFEALVNNISLNNLEKRITAFNCGVGAVKEKVFFNIQESVKSSSHINRESTNKPNIDIERFDDIIKKVNIDPEARVIMKLDVEGMEPEAIKGAKQFIETYKNLRVIFEHFPEDELRNDKCLLAICDFEITDIDDVNRLAIKK